jgi:hypothetical protein
MTESGQSEERDEYEREHAKTVRLLDRLNAMLASAVRAMSPQELEREISGRLPEEKEPDDEP